MRPYLLTLVLFTIPYFAFSQAEANFWYFGNNLGLDFSSGEPIQIFDGALESFEGCATVSDAAGNLLFYTNGGGRPEAPDLIYPPGSIWNRNHEVMYDMQGVEGGGFSSYQSSIIVPKPNECNVYYLFTMDETEFTTGGNPSDQPQGRGLSYFEIDMTLNDGLGGVTIADERIYVPTFEGLTAVQHSNGQDFWIIVWRGDELPGYVVVPVTEDGVGEPILKDAPGVGSGAGIKASPDGKFIYFFADPGPVLGNFDNTTGEVTSFNSLPGQGFGEFSQNSKYLYTFILGFEGPTVNRFDLEAPDIPGSLTFIAQENSDLLVNQVQLAPDGNIYFLRTPFIDFDYSLGRINSPNEEDAFVDFNAFDLVNESNGFFPIFFSLPNFPAYLFSQSQQTILVDLGPDLEIPCTTGSIILDPETGATVVGWSTGESSETIEVSAPGIYSVTVTDGCITVADTIEITGFEGTLEVSQQGPVSLCEGNVDTLFVLTESNVSYNWSTGSNEPQLIITEGGNYNVTVTDECDNEAVLSFEVATSPGPDLQVNIEGNLICVGDAVTLTAQTDFPEGILWSTGATTPELSTVEPGSYTITVTNNCGEITGEINLESQNLTPPQATILGAEQLLCEGSTITLTANSPLATSFEWSTGSMEDNAAISTTGPVQLITTNICGADTAEVQVSVYDLPLVVDIDSPSSFCENSTATLIANSENAVAFEWLDGTLDNLLTVNEAGTYTVIATDICGSTAETTITLDTDELPIIELKSIGTLDCLGEPISLQADGIEPYSYIWSTGDTLATIEIFEPGRYEVMAINDCGNTTASISITNILADVYVPNAFSPNDDGINDLFQPLSGCGVFQDYNLKIFSRFGELVFDSDNPDEGWDGRFRGQAAHTGIYTWLFTYTGFRGQERLVGDVMLMR